MNPGPGSNERHLEMQLFERIVEKIDSRFDALSEDVRDVRERLIRFEAQDVAAKVTLLENRITVLERWQARVTGQVALIIVPIAAAVGATIKLIIDLVHH